MPRITAPKCPNCQAQMPVAPNAAVVRCEYCGTEAQLKHTRHMIGGTTIIAELLKQVGQQMPRSPSPQQRAQMQMAQQAAHRTARKVTVAALVVPLVLMVVIGGFTTFIINKTRTEVSKRIEQATGGTGRHSSVGSGGGKGPPEWRSSVTPMLAEVDSTDGPEVVAWIRVRNDSVTDHIAAYDLPSGRELWRTGALEEGYKDNAFVVGDSLLHTTNKGKATAFALADGAIRWSIPLGEVAESVCLAGKPGPEKGGEPLAAIVTTRDEKRHRITLTDGAMTPAKRKEPCTPVWSDETAPGRSMVFRDERTIGDQTNLRKIDGFYTEGALSLPDDNLLLLLGTKRPGTQVPMMSAHRCKAVKIVKGFHPGQKKHVCKGDKALWTQNVPSGDPLQAGTGEPSVALLTPTRALAAYGVGNKARIAAFEIDSGKRAWEWEIADDHPGARGISYVIPMDDHVLVGYDTKAFVLELKSGKEVQTLGR